MSRTEGMRYAMAIEKGELDYSAHLHDLPGRVATGKTLEDVKRRAPGVFWPCG
ncbi:MAG TPA: hypothetical protein VD968_18255 [Pyrinomonadaceae bacterium]|nr:hypothetical protein [Pyrinomonadaceae bacterium]